MLREAQRGAASDIMRGNGSCSRCAYGKNQGDEEGRGNPSMDMSIRTGFPTAPDIT